jgi:hypothetical protein
MMEGFGSVPPRSGMPKNKSYGSGTLQKQEMPNLSTQVEQECLSVLLLSVPEHRSFLFTCRKLRLLPFLSIEFHSINLKLNRRQQRVNINTEGQ